MVFVFLRFYLEHRVEPFMFRSLNLSNDPVGVCCGVGHHWSRVRPGAGTSENGPLRSRAGRPWPRAWPRRVDLRRQVVGSLSVGESAISNVCFGVQTGHRKTAISVSVMMNCTFWYGHKATFTESLCRSLAQQPGVNKNRQTEGEQQSRN
jgi:hypothetical protein